MISFKIISQNLFQRLQKNQHNALSQIESLIRTNNQLVETVQQGKSNIAHAELQLQAALTKNQQLQQNQISLQNLLLKSADQLSAEIQKSKALNLLKNETTSDLNAVLKQKAVLSAQNSRLLKKIAVLEQGLVLQNKKILQGQIKEQQFHLTIQKLSEIIKNSNLEKDQISQNLKEKNNEIRNLKHQLEERTNLVEKLASEYEVLKEQTQACQKQLETLKDSPIAKVEEKLKGKQIWINELTATINQLKQRCIRLQMGRPDNMHPITANRLISGQKYENPGDTQTKAIFHKSYNEQAQRLRYLNICRQFLQQFNKKLKKIHQQKKSIEQKYHCIKLKINDYQYNEFKYKDKLSLYLQKIQRYEKLTEKQQNQMEKLITEFDKELSDVIKTKQDEIKEKIQAEISKHLEKENGRGRLDESSLQVEKHDKKGQFGQIDEFQFEMLKKQIQFLKLELKKYKQSKRHYKIQKQKLEKQCQNSSNELRRYKYLIQQLWKQLDIKTNENQILKSNFVYSTGNSHKSNQYANSRRQNGEDLYENLSARLSARNQQIGKNSSSDHFQYQTSQIDTELMRKNQTYLNKLMFHKHQTMQQSPAGPQGEVNSGRFKRNQSDISSQSQDCSFKQSQSSSNNSPSNSFSSKNSYKSYGIKYLYTDNKHSTQNIPYKFILHKNSLQ